MRVRSVLFVVGFAVLVPTLATAQKSLFDQPASNEPSAEAPAEPAKPKARPKPKPRGPVPSRTLQISNAGSTTVSTLEVAGDGKSAKLGKPLAPNDKVVLKLPAFKTCTVSVTTTFEGAATPDTVEHDLCKDKAIRFTE